MIAHLNTDKLYEKALIDNVPFFDWHTWIENTIQKEVFSQLRRSKLKTPDTTKSPKASTGRKNSLSAKKSRTLSKGKGNTPTKDKSQVSGLVNTYNYSFNAKDKKDANPYVADKNASSFQSK